VITILYSVIDIGSNTIRLVTYDLSKNNCKAVYTDYRALGLVSEIENDVLKEKAVDELCKTLAFFKNSSPKGAVIMAFATAFMRVISNSAQVIQRIVDETGIEIEVLSEEKEALYSFKGVISSISGCSRGIVSDLGGGSCEFIRFSESTPTEHTSFKFGCVKLFKMFVSGDEFPKSEEITDIYNHVTNEIQKTCWLKDNSVLIMTGGTARAVAQMDNFFNQKALPLSNYTLTKEAFNALYNAFTSFDKKYTDFIFRALNGRIKTIYPGIVAIKAISDFINCDKIIISTEGVREGYLSDKLRR